MKLQDKVAIITGAGSGIGKATAELFAREGASVVIADINGEAAQKVAQGIKAAGGKAEPIMVDVTKTDDIKAMINKAVETYGKLDILFNNAGLPGESFDDTTEEKWRLVMDINVTAPFLASKLAAAEMKKAGGGCIVMTGSTGGIRAGGRSASYATSKAAVIMLARALAKVLAKDKIRVNSVCPGSTYTGMTEAFLGYPKTEEERRARQAAQTGPMGRQGKPEEIAAAVLFLVSDDSSYVTGHALMVDGGLTA